jgi:hypothetical protein
MCLIWSGFFPLNYICMEICENDTEEVSEIDKLIGVYSDQVYINKSQAEEWRSLKI